MNTYNNLWHVDIAGRNEWYSSYYKP